MSEIPVLYSFARSGGTLVNQFLGVHPQCLVLSEVNPAASVKPVAEQAVEWLRLVPRAQAGEFAQAPYAEQIARLREAAERLGRKLVVRDWVTVNFLPGTIGERVAASGVLEQEIYLGHAGLEAMGLVVARRAAAVYRSIRHNFAHLAGLALDTFARAYVEYARAVEPLPKVHIEAIRAEPRTQVAAILRRFGVDEAAAPSVIERFHEFTRCTGNTQLRATSESARARGILPPDDEPAGHEQPLLAEADRIMGYGR